MGDAGVVDRTRDNDAEERGTTPLHALLESLADLVFVLDADGRFVFCNAVSGDARLLVSPDKFLGKRPCDVLSPDVNNLFNNAIGEAHLNGSASFDYTLTMPDGEHWFAATISRLVHESGSGGWVAVVRDITQRHEAEAALRDAEERWRSLVENTSDNIMLLDRRGIILYINHAAPGLDRDAVIGTSAYDYVPEECVPSLRAAYERVVQTGKAETYETFYVEPDGTRHTFEGVAGPIVQGGRIMALTVVCRDITARKMAEKAVQESEARFRTLFNQVADPVLVVDVHTHRIVDCNAGVADIFGYERKEALNLCIEDLGVGPVEFVEAHGKRAPEARKSSFETTATTKSGDVRHVEVQLRVVAVDGSQFGLAVLHDITESRQIEKSVVEAAEKERRDLVFNLHDDLGQHLAGLQMVADSLCQKLTRDHPDVAEGAGEVRELAKTALRKTRELVHGFGSLESGASGLLLGLERLVSDLDSHSGAISVRLDADEHVAIRDVEVATQLYRIAEEALSNAVRHANAHEIVIRLAAGTERINLEIVDDGDGGVREEGDGMGTRIMRFRTAIIGGTFTIDSPAGRGTRVSCSCPIPTGEKADTDS